MPLLHKHHIIPKHAGGTDDPENLVYLTVEQHAEAHKKLYEEHGRWQDRLAWQGLAGIIGHEDRIAEINKQNGLRNKGRPSKNKGRKYPQISERFTGVPKSEQAKMNMRGKRPNFIQKGENNNNAKKIKTPYGIFNSIVDASEDLGIKYNNLYYKMRSQQEGWEYI